MTARQQLLTPQHVLQQNWWAAAAFGAAAASFMMRPGMEGMDQDRLQMEILKGRLIRKPKIEAVEDGGEDK